MAHVGNKFFIDHATGQWGLWNVEADDFALGLKGFPIHLLDVLISHIVQNIVAKDFDIKTGDSFGEAFSCIAIANDA